MPDAAPFFPDARVLIPGDMDIKASALFSNVTFNVTDRFRLKAGTRYSHEHRDIMFVDTILPVAGPPNNPGVRLATGSSTRSFSDFTPEAGFEFDIGRTMLYGTYSEGFKSGSAALVDGTPNLTDPETIKNWEAGLKGRLFDGALNFSLAGFISEVKGAQFDRTRLIATGPRFDTSVENAAVTTGKGLEIDGTAFLSDEFSVDFRRGLVPHQIRQLHNHQSARPAGRARGACRPAGAHR